MRIGSVVNPEERVVADSKLRKAAQEFEGQLLTCLLEPLERAFSGSSDSQSDQYGFLGIEALSQALSQSGGIGLGNLVLRELARTKVRGG
jgi:Rod binding domain-containing protein